MIKSLDDLSIKTLKMNGVAAVNKANSGHPGIVLGAATMMHTLYTRHLNFDPINPNWINRDRFILSAGHGSALLYSQLRLIGILKEKDLRNFRQFNSLTPGHPEFGHTIGVEATTGPLGQGLAMAVGMAIAQAHLQSKFAEINHYVYTIVGDGDLQEGISYESMAIAGHLKLNHLVVMHDNNDVQLDTMVNKTNTEDLQKRVEAAGFYFQLVSENTVEAIDNALKNAKAQTDKPSFISVKTIIGEGSSKQGTTSVHGSPLGNDIDQLAKNLKWNDDYFAVPELVERFYSEWRKRQNQNFKEWKATTKLQAYLKTEIEFNVDETLKQDQASRNSVGQILNHLAKLNKQMIGGSADLSVSTKVAGLDGDFSETNYQGRNILFGVREMAMAAIANGIALHSNFRPFVSTFLVFSDYLKGAMRLSSLMKLPVLYIFSHDSIFVGEDGPTHQPIEQLASIRSIPGMVLFRPSDEKEAWGAFKYYLENKAPVTIVTTRQNLKTLENTSIDRVSNGAYLLRKGQKWTLIASGSEVENALKIAEEFDFSCYSVPSMNLVTKKPAWIEEFAISVEAGVTFGWDRLARYNIGINTFGLSAPGESVYEHFGLDHKNLRTKVMHIMQKNNK
ncbi:transketolase [Mycoplasmopsis agassizii]|uniref:transketolase n=1 Tax=Mycoplasmopsis agassizii TaxID=33922 RepID=UPI0035281F75